MPSSFSTPYVPIPYSGSGNSRLADLIRQQGIDAANARREQGNLTGQLWGSVGNIIQNTVGQIQQQQAQAPINTLRSLQAADATQNAQGAQAAQSLMAGSGPLGAGESGPEQPSYLTPEGTWDIQGMAKALSQQGKKLPVDLMNSLEKQNQLHREDVADQETRTVRMQQTISNGAATVLHAINTLGMEPVAAVKMLGSQLALNPSFPRGQVEQTIGHLVSDPASIIQRLTMLRDAQKGPPAPMKLASDTSLYDPDNLKGGPLLTTPPKSGEGDYTINGQRFDRSGQPIGAQVPKQIEPPKIGSPEDFLATYAKEKFNIQAAHMTVAQKAEALGAFRSANADQDLRDAALAQKSMALAMANLQQGMQPNKEDAKPIAQNLIDNKMAPSQLQLFGGFGTAGQAFKRMVLLEAQKLDPSFNLEEAEATYQLSKSSAFQNTVRFMDSIQESIPRVLKTAQNLGNGQFRSMNELANASKNQFSSTDLKRFKTDALLVGDEIAKILSGGGTGSTTSDFKLKQGADIINSSDSIPAIAAALDEVQALIGYRRKSLTRGTYMERANQSDTLTKPTELPAGVKIRR